jgi:DNA-binding GntR family transcriptional regulator
MPGTPLVERLLAARFGVSRTPLREALIRLAEEGLVEIFPQSGTFVGRIPIAALPEAMVIRQALESAALSHAIARARPEDDARLEAVVARQKVLAATGDKNGFHAADESFHEIIADIAGHPGLWRIAQQTKAQIDRLRRMTLPVPGRMDAVIADHDAILEAFKARDRASALAALERHLSLVVPDAEAIRTLRPHYFI